MSAGRDPNLRGKIWLARIEGTMRIGDYFKVDARLAPTTLVVRDGARLVIGDLVFFNGGVTIDARHEIRIGNHVMLAPFATVMDDDWHQLEPGPALPKGPTVIGDNVWLGRNVTVMPGVTVGAGSVIGAHSVVTRDIPGSCFAAGVPARVVRELAIPDGWVRN